MIWLLLAAAAALTLAPLAWSLRRAAAARGRREADVALHRAQLAELDRDAADGRIGPAEHAAAMLEVQRRLIAAAGAEERGGVRASRGPVLAALVLVPLVAVALYLPAAQPFMPAAPLAQRIAEAERRAKDESGLIAELRQRIATLDPKSERARQGYLLLGNVEDARGNLAAAAAAWRAALDARFEPGLAAQVAEAMTRLAGHVPPEAAALFRAALAQGPANAPWRKVVEQRLAEAGPR